MGKKTLSDFDRSGCLMSEMQDRPDFQLLYDFAKKGDEAAFREIVVRHMDLVYSAALRQVESSTAAADIAQSVFTDLSRKAGTLTRGGETTLSNSLAGWLHRATRYAALNYLRDARRRTTNERQAMEQLLINSESSADWEQIRPMLDEALDSLGDEDRGALLLRYFKNQDFRAVGLALGVSDDAAQKRVSRALERLREFVSKRKVTIGASGLAALISVNAVQSAPAGLAATISAAALLTGTAVTASTAIAVTKTVAMTALQKTLVTITVAALAGAGVYEAHTAAQLREQNQMLQQQQASQAEQIRQLQRERDEATKKVGDLLAENLRLKSNPNQTELLKLRGEVAQLHNEASDPTENTARAIANKVAWLKQRLEQMPAKKIPELQLLTEKDWADVVWDADLNTDDGIREALSKLRDRAESMFLDRMHPAFRKYLAANNDTLPTGLAELKPYFDVPVDDAMFERYQLLQNGKPNTSADLVKLAAPYADEDYDSDHHMSLDGQGGSRFNKVQQAVETAARDFSADNNSQVPDNPSQITPYLKATIDAATVDKYLNQYIQERKRRWNSVETKLLSRP